MQTKQPRIRVHCVYSTKGQCDEIHPNVITRARALESKIKEFLPNSEASVEMIGARELLNLSQKEKTYTLSLRLMENPLSKGDNNYIALASLQDYAKFVTDEEGNLREYIFDSNVRDYQGKVEVNEDIRKTLESVEPVDFWWLNNGITVLASGASIAGKTIAMDDVQIVNGLQTTRTIINYMSALQEPRALDTQRALLVRVIVAPDSSVRDRIIKATNFQTAVPAASLKATDKLQRDLEGYFVARGLYYDRRKNYYKNTGKPSSKIIGIPALAQSVMAILLKEPDNARARPSSLIKRESEYVRVFSETYHPNMFLFCAKSLLAVGACLREQLDGSTREEREHFRFHIALRSVAMDIGRYDYCADDLASRFDSPPSHQTIVNAAEEVTRLAREFGTTREWERDRVAKSREFVESLVGTPRGAN